MHSSCPPRHSAHRPTRPHPGAESAKANLAAGAVLGVVDRVRDAIRSASEGKG